MGDHQANIWRSLLNGDGPTLLSFSQRVNAAFHLIASASNTGNNASSTQQRDIFTLQDFMERGFEAMNALDLHVLNAQSSTNDATKRKDMFGTMDYFRSFDRRGQGKITKEDFVIGITERIRFLTTDTTLLKHVAEEIIGSSEESKSLLLQSAVPLSKADEMLLLQHFSKYWSVFSKFHYQVMDYLHNTIYHKLLSDESFNVIDDRSDGRGDERTKKVMAMMKVLADVLVNVERELIAYFHIPSKKLNSLLGNSTISGIEINLKSLASDSKLDPTLSQDKRGKVDHGSFSSHQYGNVLWNPDIITSVPPAVKAADANSNKSIPRKKTEERIPSQASQSFSGYMDDTQIFLLQTAHKALKNFFLSQGFDEEGKAEEKFEAEIAVLAEKCKLISDANDLKENRDFEGSNERILMDMLYKCQDSYRRMRLQHELMEMMHSKELALVPLASESKYNQELSHDDILEEINDLKTCLMEREQVGVVKMLASQSNDTARTAQEVQKLFENMNMTLTMSMSQNNMHLDSLDEQFRGLVSFREQVKEERNEHMKNAVELQIAKEKIIRLQREIQTLKTVGHQPLKMQPSSEEALHIKSNDSSTDIGASNATNQIKNTSVASEGIDELRSRLQEVQTLLEDMTVEKDRLLRENRRLSNAVKNAEDRVRSSLQDQMLLKSELQTAEDQLEGSKTVMQQLLDQLDSERAMREADEDKVQIITEMKRDLLRKETEIVSLKDEASTAKKIKQELATAESLNSALENRVTELTRDVEKGAVAMEQLDRYHDQVRELTKHNRELSLTAASLENQLKAMQQLQSKYKEACVELNDLKLKVEKIPGLLAEISRLRGSSRASMKALTEQDKQISDLRAKIKAFEKENTHLASVNRSMKDVELKLRDATMEINRLTLVAGEVTALKTDAKNAEEERKTMERTYRTMKKMYSQPGGGRRTSAILGANTGISHSSSILMHPSQTHNHHSSMLHVNKDGMSRQGHSMMTPEEFGDIQAELYSYPYNQSPSTIPRDDEKEGSVSDDDELDNESENGREHLQNDNAVNDAREQFDEMSNNQIMSDRESNSQKSSSIDSQLITELRSKLKSV